MPLTASPLSLAIPSGATAGTYNGTITVRNSTTGCISGGYSIAVTVIQNPWGDLSSWPAVCTGTNSGTLTLSNPTGTIIRWEYSTDGGNTFPPENYIANTGTTQDFLNLTQTRVYRVLIELGACQDYSNYGIVPVNPLPLLTVSPAAPPPTCFNQPLTLVASSSYVSTNPLPVDDFGGNPHLPGWTGAHDARNNNENTDADWGVVNNTSRSFNGVTYYSNVPPVDSRFVVAMGNTAESDQLAILVTPPFSLLGMDNPFFNFYTAYNFEQPGTYAFVEISTNGGSSWDQLRTFSGHMNPPYRTNNNWLPVQINLSSYIGESNVSIRFRYLGSTGSNWAIDNAGLTGTIQPVIYQWGHPSGDPLPPGTTYSSDGRTITVTPPVGTYHYCVTVSSAIGCTSLPVCVDVTVNPLPDCSITSADGPVCPSSANVYTAPCGHENLCLDCLRQWKCNGFKCSKHFCYGWN